MTDNLAEFLLAQIAADEEVARACVGINELAAHINGAPIPRWVYDSMRIHSDDERRIVRVGKTWAGEGAHIARWDPARVLAECAAKRRVVEFVLDCAGGLRSYMTEQTLRLLAQPYRDRPGWREEWDIT